MEFDVHLSPASLSTGGPGFSITRFQNNIQSLFQRVRLLYGSSVFEDIDKYNVIVRALTEWTGTNQQGTMDQTSIADGVGGVVLGTDGTVDPPGVLQPQRFGLVNVRQAYIHGWDGSSNTGTGDFRAGFGFGSVPNAPRVRRYQVNLALGMFTQDKLLPTKFMASQLALEITLEQPAGCIFVIADPAAVPDVAPTYSVTNVNIIPEILEFDSSYDAMFLKGLRENGVPIKVRFKLISFLLGIHLLMVQMVQLLLIYKFKKDQEV